MIRPHVPELGMPEGHDRARLCALRSLVNCGVVRVTFGSVPLGFRLLQMQGHLSTKRVVNAEKADCRLTDQGMDYARQVLRPPFGRFL